MMKKLVISTFALTIVLSATTTSAEAATTTSTTFKDVPNTHNVQTHYFNERGWTDLRLL